MYVPAHFAADDESVRRLLDQHGAADLVTVTPRGSWPPSCRSSTTRTPGRAAPSWATSPQQRPVAAAGAREALVIVRGPDAYVSPSWYAAKAEHGRVVPDLELRHCPCLWRARHP